MYCSMTQHSGFFGIVNCDFLCPYATQITNDQESKPIVYFCVGTLGPHSNRNLPHSDFPLDFAVLMDYVCKTLSQWEGDNDNGPRMVRFCACVICF